MPAAELSYIKLPQGAAKVACFCGWETAPFRRGPFDPAEALAAFSVEHLECLPKPKPAEPSTEEVDEMAKILIEKFEADTNDGWGAVARAAIAMGARPQKG